MADIENRDKSLEAKDPLVEQLKELKVKLEKGDTRTNFTEQIKKTPAAERAEQLKLDQLRAAMLGNHAEQTSTEPQKTPDQIQKEYEEGLKGSPILTKKGPEGNSINYAQQANERRLGDVTTFLESLKSPNSVNAVKRQEFENNLKSMPELTKISIDGDQARKLNINVSGLSDKTPRSIAVGDLKKLLKVS